ncbi:putative 1,4-beta-D-xylan synthase [Helianthus annuus]|nr:putative 1,4-beta-D-xylan synthase [Helianthus annuus]KAJ0806802.1 putative 1,4-beta-D-xylan synthase [Helianthus annuus]KAJ0954234.1 putative 1,4-beta-D-xylan synthase [Helianthus annuus]
MASSPKGVKKATRRNSNESDRQVSLLTSNSKTDFDQQRWLFESKGKYGIGNACWQDDDNKDPKSFAEFMDKPWKPLTRKTSVPASVLSPYRLGALSLPT